MNNKKLGNDWEKECLDILGKHGFFATKLQEKQTGAPFDLIATKDNVFYAIECKEIEKGNRFTFSRIESNQRMAYKRLVNVNSPNYYFLFKCPDGEFVFDAKDIISSKEKSIDVTKGIKLDEWLKILYSYHKIVYSQINNPVQTL